MTEKKEEMKIKNNKFFLFEAKSEKNNDKWLSIDKKESIDKLKKYLEKDEYDVDDLAVFEVDTSEEKWKIQQIGWKDIAKDLVSKKEEIDFE